LEEARVAEYLVQDFGESLTMLFVCQVGVKRKEKRDGFITSDFNGVNENVSVVTDVKIRLKPCEKFVVALAAKPLVHDIGGDAHLVEFQLLIDAPEER
jgi:hypothetical protein